MNCCLFKKSSSSSNRGRRRDVQFPSQVIEEIGDITVYCGRCKTAQTIPSQAVAMVCSGCRCVNRIRKSLTGTSSTRRMSFIDCNVGESQTIPNTPALFQLGDGSDGSSIPICSVCLDGVGDMILDLCGHGGLCEDCARHIALNKAVGGAHCPLDKEAIVHVLRIGELRQDFVKARQIELPQDRSTPPKVPPPVGMRKAKQQDSTAPPTD